MGEQIRSGRFSVRNDDEVVLFLVGIRVNRWRAVRKWLPVLRSLRPMLREAVEDGHGLVTYRVQVHGPRELVVVQYWRGVDELMDFSDGATHRAAWRDFYKHASGGAAVGIWHETYVVPAGRYEAIYGIVPPAGLAKVQAMVPVGRRNEGARVRLDLDETTRTGTAEPSA
ncbi:DUF4188 domain-containing protein [Actinomadura terrae]|uniref:DUF4188 domain-containing protein n=1 Tax=Actinomadura terrae TaxID=604353 RepID=UPI001FA7EA3B|nr:DUF4188 domain-containing protein [Actinomadura terrae]